MTTSTARPAGRVRQPGRELEILRAVLDVLAEEGYDRLTMDAVGERAHAGKATLYRRWTSKADLVVDAIGCLSEVVNQEEVDTGDLLARFSEKFTGMETFQMRVITGLFTAMPRHPDLEASFQNRFLCHKRDALRAIFERARARGEIGGGCDLELIASVPPALVLHRLLMTTQPVDAAFAARMVDEVVLPLAAAASTPASR